MLALIAILGTFAVLVLALRYAGFVPFPGGFIASLLISQILFWMAHENLVVYEMHALFDYGGLDDNFHVVLFMYLAAAIFAMLTIVGKFDELDELRLGGMPLQQLVNGRTVMRSVPVLIGVVAVHLFLLGLISDWSKLWFHRTYLQPSIDGSVARILGDEFCLTIMRATPFFGILSVVSFCLLSASRIGLLKSAAALMGLAYFLVLLSFDSRSAAFVPVLIGAYYLVLRLKHRAVVAPLMGILAALSIMSALNGRGLFEHGLSVVPHNLVRPFTDNRATDSTQILLDFSQGIFVTAESLQLPGDFPTRYKVLSLSPLPSLIDGFSLIQAADQRRLHPYVPMSGVGEIFHFGIPYLAALAIILILIVRTHVRLARDAPVLFLLCNFLVMFSSYLLFSYPLRNGLRYAWLGFFVALAVLLLQRIRAKLPDRALRLERGRVA